MVGKAGVAGRGFDSVDGLQAILHELGDIKLLEERLDRLAKAKEAAEKAKRDARRAARLAVKEAEEQAEKIIQAAEEQAQDRLGAIEDLQKRLADDRRAWELEKSEEQAKLRSDRSKLGAATKAANEAKEKADKEKAAYEALGAEVEESRQELNRKYLAMQEIWRG